MLWARGIQEEESTGSLDGGHDSGIKVHAMELAMEQAHRKDGNKYENYLLWCCSFQPSLMQTLVHRLMETTVQSTLRNQKGTGE